MADKLSDQQLGAIISQQIELAKHDRKLGGRDASRTKALDYYFGNMDSYVPPEVNRSKVVSTDVRDVINWLLPQLLRVFTAARSMFVAQPREEGDVHYAEDVTDGLNYIFWDENNGYEVVHSGTWDSLLHGDGIVKTFYDKTPVYSTAKYHEALTEDERDMLAGDDDVEVLAQTENKTQVPGQPMPDHAGQMVPGPMVDQTTYDLKVRHKKANGRYVVDVISPEDFLVSGDAISLEDAGFKDHWDHTKTRSDLVVMGYDKALVWTIPVAAKNETSEQAARSLLVNAESTDKSTEIVDYHECFVMIDADGDGVAEMIRVCCAGPSGEVLLDWEVWEDEDPFDNIRCKPIPHRWDSNSIADDEIEIQDVKTVLKRQMLNNTYKVNNPQIVVTGPGVSNPDQIDNPTFGGAIFAKTGTTVAPLPQEYIGEKALAGIHYMDEETAKRTGVNSQSMALDPETLQNQSATANQNATDASRSQPEMIARNMAEGWAKVGRKLLRLMAKHEDGPRTIMAKGKPRPIDPKSWNPDMHVKVNTGLGTGSRDRDAQMLSTVLQQQIAFTDRIGAVFPEKALDMLPYIHATLTKFAESTGLQNPELYWPEIDPQEIEQGKQLLAQRSQQPDPQIAIEQAKGQVQMQLKQADVQSAQQIEQGRQATQQQLNQLESERQVRQEAAQLQADLQTKEADRQNAIQIESVKQQYAAQIEMEKLASQERIAAENRALEREKLAHSAQLQREGMANAQTIAAMKPKPEPGKPAAN